MIHFHSHFGSNSSCLAECWRESDTALSSLAAANRALVSVLLALARSYSLLLTVNRELSPEQLLRAYRQVLKRAHPDKGGKKPDAQKLQAAKEAWDNARKTSNVGRPKQNTDQGAPNTNNGQQNHETKPQDKTTTKQQNQQQQFQYKETNKQTSKQVNEN